MCCRLVHAGDPDFEQFAKIVNQGSRGAGAWRVDRMRRVRSARPARGVCGGRSEFWRGSGLRGGNHIDK